MIALILRQLLDAPLEWIPASFEPSSLLAQAWHMQYDSFNHIHFDYGACYLPMICRDYCADYIRSGPTHFLNEYDQLTIKCVCVNEYNVLNDLINEFIL